MRHRLIIVRSLIIIFLSYSLTACVVVTNHKVNHQLAHEKRHAPKKMIILPIDIRVHEISAGGSVEEINDWSTQARDNLKQSIERLDIDRQDLEILALPNLTEKETQTLEEHVALYELVFLSALEAEGPNAGPLWKKRLTNFDYTLGHGLSFLDDKSDADAALILIGADYISSAGRKAAIVMAAMLGAHIQSGHAFLTAGIVDLKTGDVLWIDHSLSVGNLDLRKPEDVKIIVSDLFKDYPGIKSFLGSI